ncbi:MAG: thioredoxin-related protein [Planctomycetota bacterium]|jgi:thioredoxin-related protein
MNLTSKTIALAFAGLIASTPSAAPVVSNSLAANSVLRTATDETAWVSDYDVAVKLAKEQGKDLLVDFTGSDWCGWCIKLDEEVFAHEEFLTYATANYVLVALDYPRKDEAMARVPNPARNQELAQLHGVEGFPTILLMTATGDVFGRTGYAPGGPKAYVQHLTELRESGRGPLEAAMKLTSDYQAAEGEARQALLLQILDLLDSLPESSALAKLLIQPARDAMALDPDNAKGLRFRAVKGLLNSGLNDDDLCLEARKLDPKNEGGLFELGVLAKFRDASEIDHLAICCDALDALIEIGSYHALDKVLFMLVNAAIWNEQFLENTERAKIYARLALHFEKPLDDEDIIGRLNMMLIADPPAADETE